MGLRLTKETLNESITASSLEAAMAFEDRHQSLLSRTADSEEAIQAFLQKRAPDSQGKSFFELRVFFSSEGYKDNNA
jgi:enoyl-CoA hydratase/carnithine racemase